MQRFPPRWSWRCSPCCSRSSSAYRWHRRLKRGTIIDTIVTVIALASVVLVFGLHHHDLLLRGQPGLAASSGRIATMTPAPAPANVLDGLLQGRPEFTLDALQHHIMPALAVAPSR